MPNLVKHPETGQPVYELTSYQEVERGQLEADVTAKQSELDNAARELEEATALVTERTERKTKAEEALEDSKRNVAAYDEIAPQPESNEGSEGASSESENANEEGEVSVPVTVEGADPVF